jgi:hypothetical protein
MTPNRMPRLGLPLAAVPAGIAAADAYAANPAALAHRPDDVTHLRVERSRATLWPGAVLLLISAVQGAWAVALVWLFAGLAG